MTGEKLIDEQSLINRDILFERWRGEIEMDVDGIPDTFQEYLLKYYPSLVEQEEVQTG